MGLVAIVIWGLVASILAALSLAIGLVWAVTWKIFGDSILAITKPHADALVDHAYRKAQSLFRKPPKEPDDPPESDPHNFMDADENDIRWNR